MTKITLMAVGGCGANLVRQIDSLPADDARPAVDIAYIDTSESNLRRGNVDKSKVFLFEGVDGSGKVRAENNALISKSINKILQAYKPGDFNLIVSSASGGSGAVIAHHLISELKARDEQVVLILIGSTASHIEIDNTIKTLKSLDAMAAKVDKPMVVHYLENSPEHSRSAVDGVAVGAILMLLALFAGHHDELDTADLRNWLNHPALGAELVSLQIARTKDQYSRLQDIVSVATLATGDMNTILEPTPAYQAVGYVPDSWVKGPHKLIGEDPISYVLSSEIVEKASSALLARKKDVDRTLASRVKRDSLVRGHEDVGDDGLIL